MSSENTINLKKVYMEYADPTGKGIMQFQTELLAGDGLSNIKLPFDKKTMPEDITMKIFSAGKNEPDIAEGSDLVKAIITGENNAPKDIQEKIKKNRLFGKLVSDTEYFDIADEDRQFPTLTLTDITERDIFGEIEISAEDLQGESNGIWAWHGLRKFSLQVDGLDKIEEADNAADFKEKKVAFYWYKVENEDIAPLFEEGVRFKEDENKYIVYVNTNNLGEALRNTSAIHQSKHPMFSGRFEIHYQYRNFKNVYSFPIRVCVRDTRLDEKFANPLVDDSVVSIDFGTSSTCAAVRKPEARELVRLSGKYKREDSEANEADGNKKLNPYENPTNLMIFSWDELYRQWQSANKNAPFVVTNRTDNTDEKTVDYDSGYTVNDVYKDLADNKSKRRMDAILSELKMIPYLLDNKVEIKFIPYNDRERSMIRVVDTIDGEDKTHFNPIAFYGYLIGRAINHPGARIYHNYKITYPVKYRDYIEILRASLEMGIKRALPRPLQDILDEDDEPFVKVEMKYEESVACLGAVVGKQIKIPKGSHGAKLFAVFDLGGGTLDTSYGMYRESTEEEIEDEKGNYTIEVFGVGGDDLVGGEKLIHNIAYQIYKANRFKMQDANIKFIRPKGEEKPQGFDDILLDFGTSDQIANTNVTILKETIARTLFKYEGQIDNHLTEIEFDGATADSASSCTVTLRNLENKDVDIELEISGIDDFLHDKIEKAVISFETELNTYFGKEETQSAMKKAGIDNFNRDSVTILMGGNASRQHYVREILEEKFPNNPLMRIGEDAEDEEKSDARKVNCKTAVAFGQMDLENINIDTSAYDFKGEDEEKQAAPFVYYVGYVDGGSGEFEAVIVPGDNSLEWKPANLIGNDKKTNLYYTASPTKDKNTLQYLNEKVKKGDSKFLWLRVNPNKTNSIEYRLAKRKEQPNADDPVNEVQVIELIDKVMFN